MAFGLSKVIKKRLAKVVAGIGSVSAAPRRRGSKIRRRPTTPGSRAGVLHRLEQDRMSLQHGRHAERSQPQQHLVADDHAERRRRAGAKSALAGRCEQGERARPGQARKTRMATTKAQ